jgi:hypothetical protein
VPDHLEIWAIEPRCADERSDVGGIVAEPMVALPVTGTPMTGLIDGGDMTAGRSERRPDAPPHGCRRCDPMDQEQRSRIRPSPGEC